MITVENHVGVLIESRFEGAPILEETDRYKEDTRTLVTEVAERTHRRVVLCTDLRGTRLFAPEVAARIIELMRGDNPRVDRNGVLGNANALLTLQVERMLIEARSPGRRRIFTDVDRLIEWLDEPLLDDERARLRRFLNREPP